jgi:hypothetical protein
MREPAQEFIAPVMVDDSLGDHRAKPRHALAEPSRHAAIVQRQISATHPLSHHTSEEQTTNGDIAPNRHADQHLVASVAHALLVASQRRSRPAGERTQ